MLRQTEARVIESGVTDPEGLYKIAQIVPVQLEMEKAFSQ
jgi:hypothetical protein